MTSGISNPSEPISGWDLELEFSDWFGEIITGKGERVDETMNPRKRELQNTLDNVGWGLLFFLFAVLALPSGTAKYVSAAAAVVGAAMLGLNGIRILVAVPVRWFSIILGTVFLVGGTGALVGVHMDVFLLFFVLAGVITIVGALVGSRRATATQRS
jgi:hypothetical protein